MSIQVNQVSKIYKKQRALNGVSFSLDKGQIIGFLGPNGAGKSTMMKILTGFVKPSKGEVFVHEMDVLQNPLEAQKKIGYLPEHNPLYADMYVREYLQFQASIFKVDKSSYYNWVKNGCVIQKVDEKLNELIEIIFLQSRQTYGTRRIKDKLLERYGVIVSRKRIRNILKQLGSPKASPVTRATNDSSRR